MILNIGYIKTRTNVKFSIAPEEGWFGQPKYSTPSKNHPSLCRSVFAFVFFILYVKPIRSLLIQRIPAGSSFRLWVGLWFVDCLAKLVDLDRAVI